MATYYTICAQRHDYDEWASENLYESFDDACDAMDEEIRNYDEYRISEYKKPNREEKFKQIQEREYIVYHRSPREHEFIIKTMKVVPKKEKPKKYVYQYYVRNNEQTEMKASPKYESFDEICNVLDKKLRELHGEDWQPRMTRDEYKKYMDDHTACAISYDFFKNDKYVLFWMEV
jgi:ribosome-associated translation inhibitor RaiA